MGTIRILRRCQLALLALLALGIGPAWADDSAILRLGFLLNFARYVEWPELVWKPGTPLHICLAPGDPGMSAQLGELSGQLVRGRPIQLRQLGRPADTGGCHVLYLPTGMPVGLPAWLGSAHKEGMLTVSDLPDFADAGGIIGLVPVAGRYRFDINSVVASQADLHLSSQLLKLARTIK
jgi:hypothetical protein